MSSVTRETGPRMAGAAVVEWMQGRGLDAFFHVPGESFLPVLDALGDAPSVRVVTCRHEGAASFAAEAFGKITGRPAVCMATRGPGAANLSIGIQTAMYDATPMIALIGLVPRSLQGARAFQEFDPLSTFASTTKLTTVVNSVESLLPVLDQAMAAAVGGRPGPAVVGLPSDVLSAVTNMPMTPEPATSSPVALPIAGQVLDAVRAARRPAMLVATSAVRATAADDIARLAEATGMRVFCAWRRFSAYDNGRPEFAGSLGLGADPAVAAELSRSDLILSFGFGLEQVTCDALEPQQRGGHVIQFAPELDADLGRLLPGRRVEQVVADPAQVARGLADAVEPRSDGTSRLQVTRRAPARRGVWDMDIAMARIDAALPDDAVVTSDAGNFAQWLLRWIRFDRARSFLGPLNGAMGYGLPAALGVSVAAPERPVWAFCGDGGFAMLQSEMETAHRLGLGITACVFDNGVYGTIRDRQEKAFPGRAFGTELGPIDFASSARAHGWQAWTVTSSEQMEAALAEAVAADGCRLLHVVVDSTVLSAC